MAILRIVKWKLARFILLVVGTIIILCNVFAKDSSQECWFYVADELVVYMHVEPEVITEVILEVEEQSIFNNYDMELLASIVFAEANTQTDYGQQLVVVTILNRIHNGRWGNSIYDVLFAPSQFCGVQNPRFGFYTEQNMANVEIAVQEYYNGNYDEFKDVLFFHAHKIVDTQGYITRWKMEVVIIEDGHTFTRYR